jgi:hypothetical protein
LYRDFGRDQLLVSSLGAAESYYKKAVSCAKFYELDPDPDLALSLAGLSNVHRDKGAYLYSKTLAKAATEVVSKYNCTNVEPRGKIPSSTACSIWQKPDLKSKQAITKRQKR